MAVTGHQLTKRMKKNVHGGPIEIFDGVIRVGEGQVRPHQ